MAVGLHKCLSFASLGPTSLASEIEWKLARVMVAVHVNQTGRDPRAPVLCDFLKICGVCFQNVLEENQLSNYASQPFDR